MLEVTKKLNDRQFKMTTSYDLTGAALMNITSTQNHPQLTSIPLMLTRNAQAQRVIAESFRLNIVEALTALINVEIKAAEDALKAVDDARLDADAKLAHYHQTNGKSAADVDAAKRKSDDAENAYLFAVSAVEYACICVSEAKEKFLREKLDTIVGKS